MIMTEEQKEKISIFIDDLLKYKTNQLEFNFFISKKKINYSIEIDTGIPIPTSNSMFQLSFGNQKIKFTVCEDGDITLIKDSYKMFHDNDVSFAKKYLDILHDKCIESQSKIIDNIVDSSYSDLKLRRDSNIGKLIENNSI